MSDHLKFDDERGVLTIPDVAGVTYSIDGKRVRGDIRIRETTTVVARAAYGFSFPDGSKVAEFQYEPEAVDNPLTLGEGWQSPDPND